MVYVMVTFDFFLLIKKVVLNMDNKLIFLQPLKKPKNKMKCRNKLEMGCKSSLSLKVKKKEKIDFII